KGREISTGANLPPQLPKKERGEALLNGTISQTALTRPFLPRHEQGLVSTRAQALCQEDGVDRWSPDIEATDDPAHANGVTHVA
ncbi:MAG TPA: hypothetical protein VJK02_12320, partial [Anaerolineales bacterium]|nr:hypothetical protein [Anaerolineales bacterium]